MSLARVLATGRGRINYRLAVTGFRFQAVTRRAMVGNVGNYFRRNGLKGDTVRFSERVHPVEATLDIDPMTLSIVDIQEVWTEAFAKKAKRLNWLAADADESTVTFTVLDSSAIPNGFVWIGSEVVNKTAAPTGTTITVTRAQLGTTAQKHFAGDGGEEARACPLFNGPPTLEGQRAEVYAYGQGDDPLGDGTLIYRGVISKAPDLTADLTTWQVFVEPITWLLKQDVAGDIDIGTRIRGVYYSKQGCFRVSLIEKATASEDGATANTSGVLKFTGFYETPAEFAEAVNAGIASACSGFTTFSTSGYVRLNTHADGTFYFEFQPGGTARYIVIEGGSPVDGVFLGLPSSSLEEMTRTTTTVGSSETYYWTAQPGSLPGHAIVPGPRSWLGRSWSDTVGTFIDPTSSAEPTYIYTAGNLGVATGDGIVLNLDLGEGEKDYRFKVSGVDNPSNRIDLEPIRTGAIVSSATRVRAARNYGTETNVAGFRDQVVAQSVSANLGGTPFVTDDDLEDWTDIVASQATARLASTRDYIFTEPHELGDLLAHEFRLIGVFPFITSDGKIDLKALRSIAQTEPPSFTIDASNNLVSKGWETWRVNHEGIINVAEVKTGYDPHEGEHRDTFRVRNVESISARKRRRTIEIAPVSSEHDDVVDWGEATDIAQAAVTLLADDHQLIDCYVPLTLFETALLGAAGTFTSTRIPNQQTGLRGVTNLVVQVLGREWCPREACGRLTLLVHDAVRGYAPAARVVVGGTSHLGGNQWAIATTASHYGDGRRDDVEDFTIGDKVEIVQQNSSTPSTQTGTVQVISAPGITVQLDGAAPGTFPGTGTWDLEFRTNAAGYTPTAAQDKYVYDADGGGLRYDGSIADVFGA